MNVRILPLAGAWLEEAAQLERRAGDVGWNANQFERELHLPQSHFRILEEEGTLVGYAGYWKVEDEAQVTNLVIDPARRRQGMAARLVTHLLAEAREEGCRRMTLDVRAGNTAAQALYRKLGFQETGRRPNVYDDPKDDAILMEKKI